MTLATLVPLVLQVSIVLIVFSLGLGINAADVLYLKRRPGLLIRSLLSMNVAMPLLAWATATFFDLRTPVKIALIALAVSPVPPLLPRKGLKAGGQAQYVFSLLVTAAVFAILFIPAAVPLIGRTFGKDISETPGSIAKLVFIAVLIPLGAGILVKSFAGTVGGRLAGPVSVVGSVLMLLGILPILFTQGKSVFLVIGDGTLVVLVVFVIAGLVFGHLLGGPEPENRTTLALFTASRHPGIAMTIGRDNFPNEKLVPAAVLLYIILNTIIGFGYMRWRRKATVH